MQIIFLIRDFLQKKTEILNPGLNWWEHRDSNPGPND